MVALVRGTDMKLQVITTNLTAGEFTPLLAGRVDIEKHNSSAKKLENVVVLKQGGATIRPPLAYQVETKVSTDASRLIGFVYSRTDAYQLEFGNLYIRVRKATGVVVESAPSVPYEIVTPYTSAQLFDIDFSQGADTMILTHPDHYPRRLRRFADDRWVLDQVPFLPEPVSEVGQQSAVTMTISLGTVGAGRTITASAPTFMASDVGRVIEWGGGSATITAFGTAVSVTATVTTEFFDLVGSPATPMWTLLGSPLTANTPSAATPIGAAITMTLAADGWRATDVGGMVEINGGLVRITGITSPLIADGVIIRELSSAVASPQDAWALLLPVWNPYRGYPKTCAFYQQRLWFANTFTYPQSIWGSRSGLYFDYTPGTDDDSAVYKTSAVTDDVNPLQFLCGAGSLIMLGYSAEVEGKGGIEKPITQTNMQINAQSEWGADNIRPATVGKEIIFVERGGTAVRAIFPQQVDGYDSTDVSVFSEHMMRDGIKAISFERKPNSVVWVCTNSGALLAFTYNREQNTIAWASGFTDGVVESISTVPTADADATDVIVRREVGAGVTKRYVERLDWGVNDQTRIGFYDCRIEQTYGVATAVCAGFIQLVGRTVGVMADGVYIGEYIVSGLGTITIPRPALHLVAGLPYIARIVLRAPEVGTGTGTSDGQTKSTNKIQIRLHESVGMLVNGAQVAFRHLDTPFTLNAPPVPFTGLKDVTEIGWDQDEGADVELAQTQGLPWTVLSVIWTMSVNPG